EVLAAARQYFRLPEDTRRLRIEIADGADWVAKTRARYDLILVDAYDADGHNGPLDTPAFYLNCKARLSDRGLLVANLLSRRKEFAASVERIQKAFDGRALAFPSCDSGNAIAIAAAGEPVQARLGELKQTATALRRDTGLNLAPTISRLERSGICIGGELKM
ncbi:MAG TPA: spermidine synthase, partial [Rhodocyclaceae bacterium]|nr:spermidine synthase [Rhodocyclaceae bacterium]